MDSFEYFSRLSKDVRTPIDLYKAIERLGPLPRYEQRGTPGGNIHGKDDSHDEKPALEQAHAVYEHARRIAVRIQARFPELADIEIPRPEADPFLGLQTVQEWCTRANRAIEGADKGGRGAKETRVETRPENSATLLRQLVHGVEQWAGGMKSGHGVSHGDYWNFLEVTDTPFRRAHNRLLLHPGHGAEELRKQYNAVVSTLRSSNNDHRWGALSVYSLGLGSLLLLCEDLAKGLDGQEQVSETAGSQSSIIADIEPLRQTVDSLRAFVKGKWIDKVLSHKDCDTAYHELIACFHPSFEYCLRWLVQHGHAPSADSLKQHRYDLMEKVRVQYLPAESNLNVLFPDNSRVEILSFAEEIERVVADVSALPAGLDDPQYAFENEGATWRIIYGEHKTTVKDSLGMKYIRYLIAHPSTPIECRDIERACSKESPESGRRMDSGEAMDSDLHTKRYDLKQLENWEAKDIEGMRDRLKAKIDDADDPARKTEIQEQVLALDDYLRRNRNKRGQPRSVDEIEKARSRVQKAINAAKKAIKRGHGQIGSHFDAVKGEGTTYVYKPASEIPWAFE